MKLHGVPLSNYFNMVKHSLLEKGLAFDVVNTRPSQDPAFLALSPMGKVPMLETEYGCLTETNVILDYLEENCEGPRLFPQHAFARARIRQLMKIQELYVETPAHALIGAIFSREIPAHVKETSRIEAQKGLAALARLVHLKPWIGGDTLTFADIFVFYSFTLSNRLTRQVYNWDMLREVPGLSDWFVRFGELEITRQVMADSEAASIALAARLKS